MWQKQEPKRTTSERAYSLAEAAFIMGISESLAVLWCERGQLEAYRDEAGAWHIPATQFLVTFEHAQKAEQFFADIERQQREADWDDLTEEEFMNVLRLNDENAAASE